MDLDDLGLFKLMSRKLDWTSKRQEVLSQNIANADTPDYKPRDLKPFTFRDALADQRRLEMKATDTGHLAGRPSTAQDEARRQRDPYETAPDGNAVILEEQILKVGRNSTDYQTMLNLYRKQVGMIRTALRGGGGGS